MPNVSNTYNIYSVLYHIRQYWDFPGGPVVKNPPCNAGNVGLIPDRGNNGLPWWLR